MGRAPPAPKLCRRGHYKHKCCDPYNPAKHNSIITEEPTQALIPMRTANLWEHVQIHSISSTVHSKAVNNLKKAAENPNIHMINATTTPKPRPASKKQNIAIKYAKVDIATTKKSADIDATTTAKPAFTIKPEQVPAPEVITKKTSEKRKTDPKDHPKTPESHQVSRSKVTKSHLVPLLFGSSGSNLKPKANSKIQKKITVTKSNTTKTKAPKTNAPPTKAPEIKASTTKDRNTNAAPAHAPKATSLLAPHNACAKLSKFVNSCIKHPNCDYNCATHKCEASPSKNNSLSKDEICQKKHCTLDLCACKACDLMYDSAKKVCDQPEIACKKLSFAKDDCVRPNQYYAHSGMVCKSDQTEQKYCDVQETILAVNLGWKGTRTVKWQDARNVSFLSDDVVSYDDKYNAKRKWIWVPKAKLNVDPSETVLFTSVAYADPEVKGAKYLTYNVKLWQNGKYELAIKLADPLQLGVRRRVSKKYFSKFQNYFLTFLMNFK